MAYSKFPGMRWNPDTCENQVFQSAEEVPAGWVDYHPSNPPEAVESVELVKAVPDSLPMSRKEIVKVLNDGGISFDAKAKVPALYDLLVDSLKAHLTEAKIEFPASATGPELLALVPQPE